jgi:putative DNA primase/helicase
LGKWPLALSDEDKVAVYDAGVYQTNRLALVTVLARILGDDYARSYYGSVEDSIISVLNSQDHRLPVRLDRPLLNCLDGMVDLNTWELLEHKPGYLSSVQFPVHFDPAATCPEFDKWAAEIIGDQLQALLEVCSQMLDPSRTPSKAPLLYGPSRSGKSTFLRLLGEIAGRENTAGVSLHALAEDQFAGARLYGAALNVCADLSSRHVQDLSLFKMMTGEDMVRGNRKYGADFFFVNQAMFGFSTNEIPTVGEAGDAYKQRVIPFKFGHSFAGHEKPAIEQAMKQELSGILNRLISAYQERQRRGTDLEIDPGIQYEFDRASDRVYLWLSDEKMIVHEHSQGRDKKELEKNKKVVVPGMTVTRFEGSTNSDLFFDFGQWAKNSGGNMRMGKGKFLQRLAAIPGVVPVRVGGGGYGGGRGFNVVSKSDQDEIVESSAVSADPTPVSANPQQGQHDGDDAMQRKFVEKGGHSAETAENRVDPPLPCPKCGGMTRFVDNKHGRGIVCDNIACDWFEADDEDPTLGVLDLVDRAS